MTAIDPDTEKNVGVDYMDTQMTDHAQRSIDTSKKSIKTCRNWMTSSLRQTAETIITSEINVKASQQSTQQDSSYQTTNNAAEEKLGDINRCFLDGCPVKWLVYSGASITQLCHHASRPASLSSWCAAACRWPLWTQSKAQHCFRLFFEWLLSVLNPFGSCFGVGTKITRFLSHEMQTNIATDEIVNR